MIRCSRLERRVDLLDYTPEAPGTPRHPLDQRKDALPLLGIEVFVEMASSEART